MRKLLSNLTPEIGLRAPLERMLNTGRRVNMGTLGDFVLLVVRHIHAHQ